MHIQLPTYMKCAKLIVVKPAVVLIVTIKSVLHWPLWCVLVYSSTACVCAWFWETEVLLRPPSILLPCEFNRLVIQVLRNGNWDQQIGTICGGICYSTLLPRCFYAELHMAMHCRGHGLHRFTFMKAIKHSAYALTPHVPRSDSSPYQHSPLFATLFP